MAESPAERTARLLAEGLELFGLDRVDEAVARWREVLALDPGHGEARDYLESAGYRAESETDLGRVAEALALAARGEAEAALAALEDVTRRTPADLEAQAALDLLRARLHVQYRQRLAAGCPRPRLAPEQWLGFDLPPEAGFLLSMLDGRTRVEELMTVAGLDPFEVLRWLTRLEQEGLVEIAS